MNTPQKSSPEGLWLACLDMEAAAKSILAKQLVPFEEPISKCYEAGVQVTTLYAERHREPDIKLAALFLKKSLNDLRSVWLLLQFGYTSQAASVSASLFENSLAVIAIAGNESNAKKLTNTKTGDLPWSPQQLAKALAQQWREEAKIVGENFDNNDYESAWREIYSGYKWLCKIKHPTIKSAIHDASSTSINSEEYVVMAAPDVRQDDLTVKATILSISVNRVYGAIRSFSFGLKCDTSTPTYKEFIERMQAVSIGIVEAFKEVANQPLPIDIGDSILAEDWFQLKSRRKG